MRRMQFSERSCRLRVPCTGRLLNRQRILLLAPRDDAERTVRQRPLQRLRLRPRRRRARSPTRPARSGSPASPWDGSPRPRRSAPMVRNPKRSARHRPFLDLPHRGPGRPDAGEEGERPGLVEGEPDRRPRAVGQRLVLGEAGEGHEAAMLGSEPGPPVRRRRLPDVGDAAIDLLAGEVLRRRRHAPARHDELAALRSVADDRRAVVRDRCRAAAACCRRGRSARRRAGASPPATSASSKDCRCGRPPLVRMVADF